MAHRRSKEPANGPTTPEDARVPTKNGILVNAFNAVYKVREQRHVSMRRALYMVAAKRLSDAMGARGWI